MFGSENISALHLKAVITMTVDDLLKPEALSSLTRALRLTNELPLATGTLHSVLSRRWKAYGGSSIFSNFNDEDTYDDCRIYFVYEVLQETWCVIGLREVFGATCIPVWHPTRVGAQLVKYISDVCQAGARNE